MADLSPLLNFLSSHLPQSDLDSCPKALLRAYAEHAQFLQEKIPWCQDLEEEIFCHYVLFPRVNDEDLSDHRRLFFDALWPRVRDLAPEEAALEVNRWCHERATYEMADERTASPLTVYRSGSGRCGEESAFLVSALRSVGLPARQVYVPKWAHCDDNHAWVEVLCGGRWRYLGACEPEPVLDRGWFDASASRAPLVHSRLFGAWSSPIHGTPLGIDGIVTYFNQTARYAPVTERTFWVRSAGRPAAGARVELQVLNEAAFRPIAVLTADETGLVRAELGPGTVHVLASLGGRWAEGDSDGPPLPLDLSPDPPVDQGWVEFSQQAAMPVSEKHAPLSEKLRAARKAVLAQGAAVRTARLAALGGPEEVPTQWKDLLSAARDNEKNILDFLRGENDLEREKLARALTKKDLRDVSCPVLEDHFCHLPPRNVPEDIYWPYVACPRVSTEPLTPWRGALAAWAESPKGLWERIQAGVLIPEARIGPNLICPPAAALAAGRWDERSGRVLYVAALRALGVPARLSPLDGAPEIWRSGCFQPLEPWQSGVLRLTCSAPLPSRQSWSLSRWTGSAWTPLGIEADWAEKKLTLSLPAGAYRLITAVRLPGGGQLAARLDLTLESNQERMVSLRFPVCPVEEALFRLSMPPLPARTLDGAEVPDVFHMGSHPALVLWPEEGAEPTEHLLTELLERQSDLKAMPLGLTLLLRGRDSLRQPTLSRLAAAWPGRVLLPEDWSYDLERTARRLALDPDAPPLAVVLDGAGHAVYAACGYQVGLAGLLVRVCAHLCQNSSE